MGIEPEADITYGEAYAETGPDLLVRICMPVYFSESFKERARRGELTEWERRVWELAVTANLKSSVQ